MKVKDLIRYFCDDEMFPDPDQEVRFVLASKDVPVEKWTKLEMHGTTVPERGAAIVALRPMPTRKYVFSLKFEANPEIEAETLEEAERKAYEMIRDHAVVNHVTGKDDDSYVVQEPYFLEEVKESAT